MKTILLIMLLFPVIVFAQNPKKKQVRICTPSRCTVINVIDSTKIFINGDSCRSSCDTCNLAIIKALIAKIDGGKENKSLWDKWGAFIIALIPILLGFLAYRYAIKQMIAKARLEWIEKFKIAAKNLINNFLRVKISYEDFYVAERKNEIERGLLRIPRLRDRNEKEYKENRFSHYEYNNNIKDLKNWEEELLKEKEKIEYETAASLNTYEEEYKNFKKIILKMHDALNEVYLSLEPQNYKTHKRLEEKIDTFFSDSIDSYDSSIVDFAETIRGDIQIILAEQWELAEGRSLYKVTFKNILTSIGSFLRRFFSFKESQNKNNFIEKKYR